MTEAQARRARQTADTGGGGDGGGSSSGGTWGEDAPNEMPVPGTTPSGAGLSITGRDMKYMAVGALLFTIGLIIGIKTLLPTQQVIKAVAAVAK